MAARRSTRAATTRGCHSTKDTRPAAVPNDSCGSSSTGCHTDKTTANHGSRHTLDLSASAYNSTTNTGCANSGAGCHAPNSSDIVAYHPDGALSCLTSGCHTSASKPTHSQPFVCGDCHDGTFVGAVDTTELAEASPGGHYGEATHTAVAMGTAVSAGGTYYVTCIGCHPGNLFSQHHNVATSTINPDGSLECAECHNANPAVTAIVTTTWGTKKCDACHRAGVLPQASQHATLTPVVTGTVSSGSCDNATCHTNLDLHYLHRSNIAGSPWNGCTMTGCHETGSTKVKPAVKTCGVGGDCHSNPATIHPSDAAKHTTTAISAECSGCHDSGQQTMSVKLAHGETGAQESCATCHNAVIGKPALSGKKDCVDCHKSAGLGSYATTYSPIAAYHYNETTHTANALGTGADASVQAGGKACSGCHTATLSVAHATTSHFDRAHCRRLGELRRMPRRHHSRLGERRRGQLAQRPVLRLPHLGARRLHLGPHRLDDPRLRGLGRELSRHLHQPRRDPQREPVRRGADRRELRQRALPREHPGRLDKDSRPTAIPADSCGSGSAGACHADKTDINHSGKHALNVAGSNYNNTTITGCTNSGSGCHGSSTSTDTVTYHPSSNANGVACMTGGCHTSPSKAAHTQPFVCADCHDGSLRERVEHARAHGRFACRPLQRDHAHCFRQHALRRHRCHGQRRRHVLRDVLDVPQPRKRDHGRRPVRTASGSCRRARRHHVCRLPQQERGGRRARERRLPHQHLYGLPHGKRPADDGVPRLDRAHRHRA